MGVMMDDPNEERFAREVATAAIADIRTVRRYLRGEAVRGFVGLRIRAAARRLRELRAAREKTESQSP